MQSVVRLACLAMVLLDYDESDHPSKRMKVRPEGGVTEAVMYGEQVHGSTSHSSRTSWRWRTYATSSANGSTKYVSQRSHDGVSGRDRSY
jgi:hypothetical protein